jgi:arylsulfatase/arylsulfatase A
VLLVIADDLGYGDVSIHGNPVVRTPTIDRLATEGLRHDPFYVCPVCTPTRASLMTGRYHLRTGAIDTYIGRAMLDPRELTLAEVLREAGYRTAIFGKWHLGDCYPLRAVDQGFDESLVHRGGGLAQNSGPPGETYFDPELVHNGSKDRRAGYCTDIFADAAAKYVREQSGQPWFVYLAFNAPHDPLQVPAESLAEYSAKLPTDERKARVYAMVTHLDRALGRVIATLETTGQLENTIVIFLSDNGGTGGRYAAGLRGTKGTMHEGGLRTPFFVRYPKKIAAGRRVSDPGAHIDVLPTLARACGVSPPKEVAWDGMDLWGYWTGETTSLPTRSLVFQYHRGNTPVRNRSVAVIQGSMKLVQAAGWRGDPFDDSRTAFTLFDLAEDPSEEHDLGMTRGDLLASLRERYESWFDDVTKTRGFAPVRIVVGSEIEPRTQLSRQDWRIEADVAKKGDIGRWELEVETAGQYRVTAEFEKKRPRQAVTMRWGDSSAAMEPVADDERRAAREVTLVDGPLTLEIRSEGAFPEGPWFVWIERVR